MGLRQQVNEYTVDVEIKGNEGTVVFKLGMASSGKRSFRFPEIKFSVFPEKIRFPENYPF